MSTAEQSDPDATVPPYPLAVAYDYRTGQRQCNIYDADVLDEMLQNPRFVVEQRGDSWEHNDPNGGVL